MRELYIKTTVGLHFFFFTGACILGYYWYGWWGVLLVLMGGFEIKYKR